MIKGDPRIKDMEFTDRATSYHSRPVARVQPRYKKIATVNVQSKHVAHNNALDGLLALQPVAVQHKPTPINAQPMPTIVHRQPQPAKSLTMNIRVAKRQRIVGVRHRVHSMLPGVPTLPLKKSSRVARVKDKINDIPANKKRGYALIFVAVLLLVIGAGVNINSFMVTKKIEAQSSTNNNPLVGEDRPDASAGYSEDQPSMGSIAQYKVAADLPRVLSIQKLGVLSRVKRVSVDAKNQIDTPNNIYDVGWYDGSSKPGEKGAVFIDGHVSGPTAKGIFYDLKTLVVGDTMFIEKGDGQSIQYTVIASETYDAKKVDMDKVLRSYDPTKQGLNLMTCTGKFNKSTQTYEKRLVVYAVRNS